MPTAYWEGPFIAETADRRLLRPGDEYEVRDQDLTSSHWRRKPTPKPVKQEDAD